MATTRDSVLYDKLFVKKYLADARDHQGALLPLPFLHTVVSGETGGASAGVQDKVNLCVIPANAMVVGWSFVAENIWASAGANGTLCIGTSDDDDRFFISSELYTAAGGPIVAEYAAKPLLGLPVAGQNYRPTADTAILATWKVANPTVGKILKGCFYCIPPLG